MAVALTYDDSLGRIRIGADGLDPAATHAVVDKTRNGVRFDPVRGGDHVDVAGGELLLPASDYEFTDRAAITYRVRGYDADDDLTDTQTAVITPELERCWLKFVARPYLNRPVTVNDWGDVERTSRNGLYDVVGRREPLVITDMHSGRRFPLVLLTDTLDEADALDLALSYGFPLLLHSPAPSGIPTMYAAVGDYTASRTSRRGVRRRFTIPLTEVAAPGPDVVGSAGSWQALLDVQPTWEAVLAGYSSWAEVAELIGDPSDIVVGP